MQIIAIIISSILFIIGLAGTVLPILPGVILIYVGMLVYGLMTGFETLNLYFFVLQGVAFAFILSVDIMASAIGSKHFDGSKQTAYGAVAGTILGLIFLGPLGIVIGPFVGAVAFEFFQTKNIKKAFQVGIGTLVGILGGTVLKIGMEIIMIIYFFIKI